MPSLYQRLVSGPGACHKNDMRGMGCSADATHTASSWKSGGAPPAWLSCSTRAVHVCRKEKFLQVGKGA